jgi:hypothetical protein
MSSIQVVLSSSILVVSSGVIISITTTTTGLRLTAPLLSPRQDEEANETTSGGDKAGRQPGPGADNEGVTPAAPILLQRDDYVIRSLNVQVLTAIR